jgi:hypothetical protein
MSETEATPLESVDGSRSTQVPVGSTGTRTLKRAARAIRQGGLGRLSSRAKPRDVSRVLLIALPSGPERVVSAGLSLPLGLVEVAQSLRAAGFQAEIYDATTSLLGAESIGLHIEHSYPQVVAAATYAATTEVARDVLRTAKKAVPGVFTVLLSMQPAFVVGSVRKDAAIDCVVDDEAAETLSGLLARVRGGARPRRITDSRAA